MGESEFHGGFDYLQRIDGLLEAINTCKVRSEYEKNKTTFWKGYYNLLTQYFLELSAKMNQEELDDHLQAKKECKTKMNNALRNIEKGIKYSTEFYDDFEEWELQLRRIQAAKGMLMPDKKSALDLMRGDS